MKQKFLLLFTALFVILLRPITYAEVTCLTPYGDMESDITECSVNRKTLMTKEKGQATEYKYNNHYLKMTGKSTNVSDELYCSFKADIKKGHKYFCTFDYKADTPKTLWTTYGESFWASAGWQNRTAEFVASENNSAITIYAVSSPQTGFCIDNFYIYDITDAFVLNLAEYGGAKAEIISGTGDIYGYKQKYACKDEEVKFKVSCIDSDYYEQSALLLPQGEKLEPDADGIYSFSMSGEDVTLEVHAEAKAEVKHINGDTYIKFLSPGNYEIVVANYIDEILKNVAMGDFKTIGENEEILLNTQNSFSDVFWWEEAVIYIFDRNQGQTLKPVTEKYNTKTYYDKYNEDKNVWKPVPVVSREYLETGKTGGEGCQILKAMSISEDGEFLVAGTDVAGLLRSLDGGENWEKTGAGFYAGSCTGLEIDPNNKNVVIAVSDYSNVNGVSGVYTSFDAAETWTQVLSGSFNSQNRDPSWRSVMFDKSSYDETLKRSKTVYWSARSGIDSDSSNTLYGLWRSDDGGLSFNLVNDKMSNCMLRVHPTKGILYAAAYDGVYRSLDKGATFEKVLDGGCFRGIDVIDSLPDNVYVNNNNGLWKSEDCGRTFTKISDSSFPKGVSDTDTVNMTRNLSVSRLNPQRMTICRFNHSVYNSRKYYSEDGGVSWHMAYDENDNNFYTVNNRYSVFIWSPIEQNTVFAFGGDYVAKSTDGGKHYYYNFDGGNMSCISQRSYFNVYDPNIICLGNQDYDGAYTTDGGTTWKSICMQNGNKWTGAVYGSYAVDENTVFVLGSTGLNEDGTAATSWNATVEIRITRDGGTTWEKTGIILSPIQQASWKQSCFQSPNNKDIWFASCMRSADSGYSWLKMSGCESVLTYNPYGKKELYGLNKNKIVVSYDDGETWNLFFDFSEDDDDSRTLLSDLTYDGINNILYFAGVAGFGKIQNGVITYLTDNLKESDCCGKSAVCAVDPRYPDVIYVGSRGKKGVNNYGIQRSVDGGKSFQVITRGSQKGKNSFTGTFCGGSIVTKGMLAGVDVYDILINPINGEVWAIDGCRGINKFAPPYKEHSGYKISFEKEEEINFDNLQLKNGGDILPGLVFDKEKEAMRADVEWKNIPRIVFSKLSIDADTYKKMKICYMYSNCEEGEAFVTDSAGNKLISFNPGKRAGGHWYSEVFDLNGNSDWKGNISELNFNLNQSKENTNQKFKFYIKYIEFY